MPVYTPVEWEDEVPGETPIKYVITGANSDCTIALKTAPTAGTPVNATNLNHIEQGIEDAQNTANCPIIARQGDTGAWGENYGTTDIDTSAIPAIIQVGCSMVTADEDTVVTFPVAFSAAPVVVASSGKEVSSGVICVANYITATTFHLSTWSAAGVRAISFYTHWIAIGPA